MDPVLAAGKLPWWLIVAAVIIVILLVVRLVGRKAASQEAQKAPGAGEKKD